MKKGKLELSYLALQMLGSESVIVCIVPVSMAIVIYFVEIDFKHVMPPPPPSPPKEPASLQKQNLALTEINNNLLLV